jgi:hypothetical protein
MTCDDVRRHLPELALGDLDAEPARRVEEHLRACAGCRGERAALSGAAAALRGSAPVAPSTERREAAAVAMARAHAEQAEAMLARPRRRWLPWAAAAAALVAAAALLLPREGAVYVAASGTADRCPAATGLWAPLRPGDALRPGDRLRGEARLSVEGGSVALEPGTLVSVLKGGRLSLDQGRVRVELGAGARRPVTVSDTGNNSVTLRRGTMEVGLLEVKASVLRFEEEKGGGRTAPGAPRTESAQRLVVRVADGEADLGGSHEQRLRIQAGQEGRFTIDGQPSTHPVQGR